MKRDISRAIAGALWARGAVWAVLLLIFSPFAFGFYFVAGFAVWFGWLWRSSRLRPQWPSVALWVASIAVNGWPVVTDAPRFTEISWWWWTVATLSSAAALICEIWIPRHDPAA